MDIERINENTFKLFITYSDIEARGYTKEDIWYSRMKGEELFWDVISEVNTDDYFDLEGPIWIHINASESGLEVVVTRANISPEHQDFDDASEPVDLSEFSDGDRDIFEVIEEQEIGNPLFDIRYVFKDIDELVPLAKRLKSEEVESTLYLFEGKYYLNIILDAVEDLKKRQSIISIANEYLTKSKVTVARLEEYGKVIMSEQALQQVERYFG